MIRLIVFFLYMSGLLVYSIPRLKKMKKLPMDMLVHERDLKVHETPQQWSRTIMKITGSRVAFSGEEHLPDGPVLFVSNHEGDFDIPLLLAYVNKPFGFISKVEVKKVPVLSSWMETMNCVFLDRKDRRKAIMSIREGTELLKQGHSILIFPEGTRSKGGPIGEFKTGGLRLGRDAGVPIVPVSIQGTADIFEKNGRLVKPAIVSIAICPSIPFEDYKNKDLKEVAAEVKAAIITAQKNSSMAP
ncbi:lysophospholipid acyltransferase family protein [Bacillus sp. FJAT-27251]|uniref:lysophospholipid acyltransferase family protein n=1 Tax=Bacillus sp. FJAT-27251 TaxID=1684142 RepID=UPI0006A7CA35|nr:lysophospholipid acyltransferase family protein [Bacillus sp. FJAT-27251]